MLAQLSDDELAARLHDPLPQSTPRSLGTLTELHADLWRSASAVTPLSEANHSRAELRLPVRVELPGRESAISAHERLQSEDVFPERSKRPSPIYSRRATGPDRVAGSRGALDGIGGVRFPSHEMREGE